MHRNSPIIIFQMGKVGSISVQNRLKDALDGRKVLHSHALSHLEEYANASTLFTKDSHHTLMHLEHCRRIREWLLSDEVDTINVITMVREPIERSVSAFFEALPEHFPRIAKQVQFEDIDAIALHEAFLFASPGVHATTEMWFDNQMKETFGIDVFEHLFDPQKGYSVIRQGRINLLTLRTRDVDRVFEDATEDFLGIRISSGARMNRVEEKPFGRLQKVFESRPLPHDYVHYALGTKLAKHFYSEDERNRSRIRWTKGCVEPSKEPSQRGTVSFL